MMSLRKLLQQKLNPRKYGNIILYRVSKSDTKENSILHADRIRRTGRVTRIDSYQDGYAVWTSFNKTKVSVPKGRLGLDSSAAKYLTSLLPDFWYVIVGHKHTQYVETGYFITIILSTDRGSAVHLELYEHKDFLEIYGISSSVKAFGYGTITMKALKKYCDAKKIGMVLRLVKNYDFFKKFRWLKESDSQHNFEYPDYFYKVSPKTKLRYLWT